VVNGG
jgi:low affinity Fe/Cu permease